MVFACYGVAFNIIFGSTGQLFLCTGALAGVGGYGAAILADCSGLPGDHADALTVCRRAGAGLLSWISVRRALDTIFIGIVTIAFALSYQNIVLGKGDWTNGESGIRVSGHRLVVQRSGVAVLRVPRTARRLSRDLPYPPAIAHRVGIPAFRDDGVAAELSGVDVPGTGSSPAPSAARCSVWRAACTSSPKVGPTTFEFGHVDVSVLVMLAFGGVGSLLGPVVGAAAFTWLDEFLEALGFASPPS